MYAVIETGSKQYLVEEGTVLRVEKLEKEKGTEVKFDRVLMVGGNGTTPTLGAPHIAGAAVTAKVVVEARARKVTVYKKKRRKGYEKNYGHRQPYTEVKIMSISV